jgi:hypothetical protein
VSKVVRGIGSIGSSILGFASFIPGPQQPFLAAGALGLGFLGGIGGGKKGDSQAQQLQALAQLLQRPPPLSETVGGSSLPRILAYGRVRNAGASYIRENVPNKTAYLEGIYLNEGPIDGIDAVIVDDEFLTWTNNDGNEHDYIWATNGSKIGAGAFGLGSFIAVEIINGTVVGKWSTLFRGDSSGYLNSQVDSSWNVNLWDNTHLGKGCTLINTVAKSAGNLRDTVYPNRFPVYAPIYRAALVYDPRDPSQYFSQEAFSIYEPHTSWKWSENPALCAAHYACFLISENLAAITGVDWEQIKEAADDCDRLVAIRRNGFNSGTLSYEPFAKVSASFTLDQEPRDILAKFMESCDGDWGVDQYGRFTMWVRKWEEPSIVFDGSDISDFVEEFGPSSNDVVNYAHTHYIEPRQNYQRVETALYRDAKSEAEVGRRTGAFAYDWVHSAGQAYRLTARRIKRENGRRRVSCVLGPRAMLALKQRVVGLNAPEYGLVGTFRVEGFAPADAALASWQADLVEISEDAYADEILPDDPVYGLTLINQPSIGTPTALRASAIATGAGVGVAQLSLDINKNVPDQSNPSITLAAIATDPTLQLDGRYSTDGEATWVNFDVLLSQFIMQTPELASGTTVAMQARFVAMSGAVGSYSSSSTTVIP